MSDLIIKKNGTDYKLPMLAEHYPADRVYLDGDITKTVQSAVVRMSGEYSFTATAVTMAINLSVIPDYPSGATIIGAMLVQKTSAQTGGYALFNSASSTVSCIDLTSGKDYGLRVLYYV